ncbi:hypothetical protein Tco_0331374 [Tanacetum coccineum]
MEILLEPTLNKLMEHMKMDVERQSVKVKELQDKCILKAFKLSYQEKYEHVGPKSQDHEMARLQDDVKEKSRMGLYMQNREHGRMILESVENGPLIWPTVEENGVIKTKKYAELSTAEKIQADCDMKAANIIL